MKVEVRSHSELARMHDLEKGDQWVDRLLGAMAADNGRSLALAYEACYGKTSVFNVPLYVHDHPYPEAFKPQQFRLGLFQHDASTESMDSTSERIKRSFAAVVASKCGENTSRIDGWSWFVGSISEADNDIQVDTWRRSDYDSSEPLPDETDIPHRLALDALFVLVVLCNLTWSPTESSDCPSPFYRQRFKHLAREGGLVGRLGYFFCDLVLVENQIPMDVLNEVNKALHRVYEEKGHNESLEFALKQAVVGCFPFICDRPRLLHWINYVYAQRAPVVDISQHKHILDCVYMVMCEQGCSGQNRTQRVLPRSSVLMRAWNRLPVRIRHLLFDAVADNSDDSTIDELYRVLPASKLVEAGIVVEATAVTLADIRFQRRGHRAWQRPSLCLPKVKITSNTVAIFRNLGLYEQLCYPDRYTVRSYLQLMDQLVDSKEDVEVLSKRGVFVNFLCNDEKAAEMWNHMCDGLCEPIHSEEWHEMIADMSQHYTKLVHSRWYEFRRNYFDSSRPWVIGGSLLFLVVTVCTIASTVIDIIGLV